ncbi:MAG: TonB-dependent receptor [Saprospiraceae bacterium]|nr:TonB-dependent receptor [Saprospiraceae bacterium]
MGNKIYTPLLTLLFIIFALVGYSQSTVKGEIIDSNTGDPLIGANVIVKNEVGVGTVTDFDGSFELKVSGFPVVLNISYIGYTSTDYTVTSAGEKVQIKMEEESVTIDLGVEIKGQRVSEKQKAAPLTIESLDAIAIKQTASTDFYNGLGSLKGVDLTTASLGFTVINTRGFNSTSPVRSLQTIDGVDNQSPGLNFSLGNFLGASELDIQKVDLVVGASSAFYGPNAFNGVIAMETKNPFFNKGLSASIKVGERNLVETAFRFADVIKNKAGHSSVAYKLNFSYLKAYDWVANNYDPVTDSTNNVIFPLSKDNPGGFNAVNIYGDEYSITNNGTDFNSSSGLNIFHRRGYEEKDIVDYNTRNIKAGVAIHIRTKPSKDFESPELIIASNFGYGTTVYQGDNRFSLRGIQFFQHKLEYKKRDKFFIRAYATHEDAGDSYDPYFTAQKMIEASGPNDSWQRAYEDYWIQNKVFQELTSMGMSKDNMQQWQRDNKEKLDKFHKEAQDYASSQNRIFNLKDFYAPGTPRYDSLFNDITSRKNNSVENGTRFFDRSALFHIHGEYKFNTTFFKELTLGANGRMYRPNTEGTIFRDETIRITNKEFGVYGGASKQFGDFTLSVASRLDKNQNFDFLFSPAGSVVWKSSDNNYFRASFSSAIRNPTLSDQYLDLDIGPARLLGNLTGFDSLILLDNFQDWRKNPNETILKDKFIAPIKPEKVRTFEVGYRTTLFEKLFVDASYYYNIDNDFIGFQIGVKVRRVRVEIIPDLLYDTIRQITNIQAYRIAANSDQIVNSQGFAIGLNYYFSKYYSFNGNYSYNNLVTNVNDDIIPAFNTPKNKYNLGFSGRDIPLGPGKNTLGFNVNYKWIEGFIFEGSPQFTGLVPTYTLVDAQLNYTLPKQNLTVKLGASNILNNLQFQTYGGPRIGRMAYLTITYDFKFKN